MVSSYRFSGVLTPVITPFDTSLEPDAGRLVEHCRWLLSQNVGLAVFGTNSEGNSLSVDEKIALLDSLVDAGIDPIRLMPGTGCCALSDTVRLTAHATKLGCGGTLMLPPFYYKGVSDDGLYASFSEVIERVGSNDLNIYLYNIPPVANITLSLELIDRLKKSYPTTIVGIKDSSGDWHNTRAMHNTGWDDFQIFVGSESFLLQNMEAGGAGCISATANVNPAAIVDLYRNWRDEGADQKQESLNRLREVFTQFPMIPALKAATARFSGDDGWSRVRPPLVPLNTLQKESLATQLEKMGFRMENLGQPL